jgi:hypothetical protein
MVTAMMALMTAALAAAPVTSLLTAAKEAAAAAPAAQAAAAVTRLMLADLVAQEIAGNRTSKGSEDAVVLLMSKVRARGAAQ